MVRNDAREEGPKKIDLEKVARLIDALERDLAKVQSGSRDVQLLRDELETLKNVLNSPIRRHVSKPVRDDPIMAQPTNSLVGKRV